MISCRLATVVGVGLAVIGGAGAGWAQEPGPPPGPGFGPPGGPLGRERRILEKYDRNRDGRLDRTERLAARAALKEERERRGPGPESRRGPGPPRRERREPAKPGVPIKPSDVTPVSDRTPLYDPWVLRTVFLDFEHPDWEAELEDFSRTDVDVPARMMVDGKPYEGVGVSFRGASSLFGVPAGYKRSLNVSVDAADPKQRLLGCKTLNLLNSHDDPTFLHSVLVSLVARQYLPAPKVNLVRVVINGENWGVYANAQQFDQIMVNENFPSADGVRWKVPGSPGARGGLEYFGEDLDEYQRRFQIKSGGREDKAWKALVNLCRVLNEAPLEDLEARLDPILDLDGALRFLAVDIVVANGDGYWTRASDYAMFQDAGGRFHLLPHDMNEAFGAGGPPPGGFRAGPPPGDEDGPRTQRGDGRGRPDGMRPPGAAPPGPTLDPLIGLEDKRMPLRSRLLSVPSLRQRYLRYVRDVAQTWLDWKNLGPVVARYRAMIEHEVEIDTRRLSSFDAFRRTTADDVAPDTRPAVEPGQRAERGAGLSLRAFADQRRRYLLDHAEIRALGALGPESRGRAAGR